MSRPLPHQPSLRRASPGNQTSPGRRPVHAARSAHDCRLRRADVGLLVAAAPGTGSRLTKDATGRRRFIRRVISGRSVPSVRAPRLDHPRLPGREFATRVSKTLELIGLFDSLVPPAWQQPRATLRCSGEASPHSQISSKTTDLVAGGPHQSEDRAYHHDHNSEGPADRDFGDEANDQEDYAEEKLFSVPSSALGTDIPRPAQLYQSEASPVVGGLHVAVGNRVKRGTPDRKAVGQSRQRN